MTSIATITQAGLAELTAAHEAELTIALAEIAIGDGAWPADADSTATTLLNEVARFGIDEWQQVGGDTIKLGASLTNNEEYTVREVGVFSATGTLFAIWERADPILLFKSAEVSDLVLTLNLSVAGLPASAITINDTGSNLSLILDTALLAINTNETRLAATTLNHSRRLKLAGL